jgi:hypothetical protein
VLDHDQGVEAAEQHGVHVDEVDGDDVAGLGGQELLSGRASAAGRSLAVSTIAAHPPFRLPSSRERPAYPDVQMIPAPNGWSGDRPGGGLHTVTMTVPPDGHGSQVH